MSYDLLKAHRAFAIAARRQDMSEAPERIWMDPDIRFPECEKQYGCDVEYTRTDLVRAQIEAAVKRALEGAVLSCEELWITADNDRDEWYDEGVGAALEAIRALDPAQFVEGDKT